MNLDVTLEELYNGNFIEVWKIIIMTENSCKIVGYLFHCIYIPSNHEIQHEIHIFNVKSHV